VTEVARNSSRKSSRYTTTVKTRILRHLDDNPRGFLVKVIAREVDANIGYVRRCCRTLAIEGLIYCKNLGIAKEYSTKCYFPANLYRVKQSPDVPLPQVHGLTMTTKYDLARQCRLGIGIGSTYRFNEMHNWEWQTGRVMSYKYGKNGVLTVYLQATLNPLNFKDLQQWISFLEGFFKIPTWSGLENWIIKQYGLNKDIFTMQTNEQITLGGLGKFFMQIYDKEILDPSEEGELLRVQRLEGHVWEPVVATAFMDLFQGGVSSYIQQQFSFSTNQLIRDLINQNHGLTRALENLAQELRRNDQ